MVVYRIRRKSDGEWLKAGWGTSKNGKLWTGVGPLKLAIMNRLAFKVTIQDTKLELDKFLAAHDIIAYNLDDCGTVITLKNWHTNE